MKQFIKKRAKSIICSVAAIVLMWLVWLIAYFAVGNDFVVPSFSDTMVSFGKCLTEAPFWKAFFSTFLRTLEAFVISFALSAALAALAAFSKTARTIIAPFMAVLRTLPTLAVVLLLLIWTNAQAAPVIVTVLVLFPVSYAQILAAADGVDDGLIQMAKVYKIKKSTQIFSIYIPLVAPNILTQTGANISLGLKIMISAEVLCATAKSLGGLMQTAKSVYYDMPRLAALTIAAVLLGLIVDFAFSQLKRVTSRWQKAEEND